jgi:hypothetical protein
VSAVVRHLFGKRVTFALRAAIVFSFNMTPHPRISRSLYRPLMITVCDQIWNSTPLCPRRQVEWFTTIGNRQDSVTSYWELQRQVVHSRPHRSVIQFDCILRVAHLIPVFGEVFVPRPDLYTRRAFDGRASVVPSQSPTPPHPQISVPHSTLLKLSMSYPYRLCY